MLEYLMSEFTFGFELEAIFNPLKLDKEYEEIYKIKGKNKRETLKLKLDLYKKIISFNNRSPDISRLHTHRQRLIDCLTA